LNMAKKKLCTRDDVPDYQNMCTKATPKDERRKMNIGDIWSNSLRCKLCNAVVRSRNRHDMVACACGNACVDGGSWYQKISAATGIGSIEQLAEMFDDYTESREEKLRD